MIITDPSIEDSKVEKKILQNISKIIKTKNYILGENVKLFEREFSKFSGAKFTVGVNSGTDAIIISLLSQNIGNGDEVILPSHSASATAMAVTLVGAKPIFIDINEDDFLIDYNEINKKITKKTKAIIAVHIYGQSCNMKKITEIADKNNLITIEDCAQAHGTFYKKKHVGNFGKMGCFSFYPTKNLGGIGDGGCIITNNINIYKKLKDLREFGWKKRYDSSVVGLNSRLDEIQAAILRIKLKKLNFYNKERNKIANNYYKKLTKFKSIKLPQLTVNSNHTYHQFVIKVNKSIRDKLIHFCKINNVMLGIHYPTPLHKQKAFIKKNYKIRIVEKISKQIVSLPIFPYLSLTKQNKIIRLISLFINRYEKRNTY